MPAGAEPVLLLVDAGQGFTAYHIQLLRSEPVLLSTVLGAPSRLAKLPLFPNPYHITPDLPRDCIDSADSETCVATLRTLGAIQPLQTRITSTQHQLGNAAKSLREEHPAQNPLQRAR